jgi:hypothetical protein
MITSLFRANANSTGIYLSIVFDSDNKPILIKKSASHEHSITRLKYELKGVDWYCKATNFKLIADLVDLPSYCSVNFSFVNGHKADFRQGYWANREYIKIALDEYCKIWKKNTSGSMVIHGDYSIDNMIFCERTVVIIDWEHFSEVDIPIGFDALNLIYEQLYMLLRLRKLSKNVVGHANSMLKNLFDCGCLDNVYAEAPLTTLRQYVLANMDIWGSQSSKLPILNITPSKARELDRSIKVK